MQLPSAHVSRVLRKGLPRRLYASAWVSSTAAMNSFSPSSTSSRALAESERSEREDLSERSEWEK